MFTVAMPFFDNAEILDFAGPYEVFTTAARVARRQGASEDVFSCLLLAHDMAPVRARGGMKVLPDCTFGQAPDADVLLVPGGDVSAALDDEQLIAWIAARHARAGLTASVCTGAFLLAKAGILDGMSVTTHWEDQEDLRTAHPGLRVLAGVPWVDCGRVVSSGGISAGIDMSLHLVERLAGRDLAVATARQMEYRWNSDGRLEDARHSGLLSAA